MAPFSSARQLDSPPLFNGILGHYSLPSPRVTLPPKFIHYDGTSDRLFKILWMSDFIRRAGVALDLYIHVKPGGGGGKVTVRDGANNSLVVLHPGDIQHFLSNYRDDGVSEILSVGPVPRRCHVVGTGGSSQTFAGIPYWLEGSYRYFLWDPPLVADRNVDQNHDDAYSRYGTDTFTNTHAISKEHTRASYKVEYPGRLKVEWAPTIRTADNVTGNTGGGWGAGIILNDEVIVKSTRTGQSGSFTITFPTISFNRLVVKGDVITPVLILPSWNTHSFSNLQRADYNFLAELDYQIEVNDA